VEHEDSSGSSRLPFFCVCSTWNMGAARARGSLGEVRLSSSLGTVFKLEISSPAKRSADFSRDFQG
jgi:hypothetical protein